MTRAFIGMGANLGDPLGQLQFAREALHTSAGMRVVEASTIYRSAPVGPGEQGDYLNAVLAIETELDARSLLARLHALEIQAGRIRKERWGPRTLDLDLLMYGDTTLHDQALTLPHPRMEERNFVLLPLADIVGHGWVLPSGRAIDAAIADCPANRIEKTTLAFGADGPAFAGAAL